MLESPAQGRDPIFRTPHFDGGTSSDGIGYLRTFSLTQDVDAACVTVTRERYVLRSLAGLPGFRGTGTAVLGMRVWKSGRTTGVTTGLVDDVSATVDVDGYPGGTQRFRNQIIVGSDDSTRIVQGGDSGSLVVDDAELAVGLLFGSERSGGTYFIANPIAAVIDALGIELPAQQTHIETAAVVNAALV